MANKTNIIKLSEREREIMNIIWGYDEPLIASEIVRASNGLTINTVQGVLKALLAKKVIEISDIVYSGTVLTRSYKEKISAEEYASQQIRTYFKIPRGRISIANLLAGLIEEHQEREEQIRILDELQQFIDSESIRLGLKKDD